MRKILAVIMIASIFSCEREIPFEEEKGPVKLPLDSIIFDVPLWCENDNQWT